MLEIVYQDDDLVAVNKPHGLLVHKTKIARDANEFAIQLLRDQIGQMVYPVHRLDRKTAGILLFALNPEMNSLMQQQFMNQEVKKTYLALVRGYTSDSADINYALTNESGKEQEAQTSFTLIDKFEIEKASGKFSTSRYSLLEVTPSTGRMHQIRKHLAHVRHPIIGDRPHGCNKQNKFFLNEFEMNTMLLHARKLEFTHPLNGEYIVIEAPIHGEFRRMLEVLSSDKFPVNFL